MPPALAAQLLGKFYGINADEKDFEQQDATETEQSITEKAADFGHGVIPPVDGKPASAGMGAV